MKYVACLLLSIVFLRTFASAAQAVGQIVISSQVRGKECCDVGADSALSLQMATLEKYKLPATFALRFDALSDPTIISALKSTSFEKAAFLEITPSLATRSGVAYRGPIDRWYKAGNAYLLGYSQVDRGKMIDTYMREFKDIFGIYPRSSVAWMIDSWSLGYLHDKYGVIVHEITREQWGTDSYTLYGGPVNIPYYPSKNWPLVPASTQATAADVLMVRQTLTDPLYTYGDEQSSFTSQPNDYMFGGKAFSYFTGLLDTALRSNFPKGFALLGLETSMESKFQDEFVKQLTYVASLRDQKKVEVLTLEQIPATYTKQSTVALMSAYTSPSEDSTRHAFWINTPKYRARMITTPTQILLSDLRVYDDSLVDPYRASASSSLNAYWTIPFLYDGSRYLVDTPTSFLGRTQNFVQSLTKEQRGGTGFHTTRNDLAGNASGLQFPVIKQDSSVSFLYTQDEIVLRYPSDRGTVTIHFLPNEFQVELPPGEKLNTTLKNQEIRSVQDQKLVWLQTDEKNGLTIYRPQIGTDVSMSKLMASFPSLFVPESSGGAVDYTKSAFIVANRRAIVNRNPIRLVIRLEDEQGNPTIAAEKPVVQVSDTQVQQTIHEPESAHGEYYIDLNSPGPTATSVSVSFGTKKTSFGTVYFVPNCIKEVKTCLTHPRYAVLFIRTKFDELTRKVRSL